MSTITRRKFVKLTGAMLSTYALPQAAFATVPARSQPNIILIMADDLGYECLSCNGSTSYTTPHLDNLAATGLRFTHCYSNPLCTPSRIQIMTGRYNFRNYCGWGKLDLNETTFAQMLKARGYTTCITGKWQLGGDEKTPVLFGFDEYYLHPNGVTASRGGYWEQNLKMWVNGKQSPFPDGKYLPDICSDFLLSFIERHRDVPFLSYYPMSLTHDPFEPTPDSKVPVSKRTIPGRGDRKYYADQVVYMDKLVGRLVQKLDELHLREKTLILFTSDNGTHSTVPSKIDNRTVMGGKGLTTNAGIHVPLIANWLRTTPRGKVCPDLIDFSDFHPTLAEASHAPLPDKVTIDGKSFFPQLKGQRENPREWSYCYYDVPERRQYWDKARLVHDKRWKLYDNGNLFDVSADPLEQNPILPGQDNPEAQAARKRLQTVLDSMIAQEKNR